MNLTDIKKKFKGQRFEKLKRRLKYNRDIGFYFHELAQENKEYRYFPNGDVVEGPSETLMNISERVANCCGYWDIDFYPFQGVKDMKRTNACHNRFCDNCQHAMSVQRAKKYEPLFDALAQNFDIYHIVFTVPNPLPIDLGRTLDDMYKHIGYIMRLFYGNAKIKGYDFSQYGFFGAIRATEITRGSDGKTFHPHFHCLFVLKKDLQLDVGRSHVNCYSFNNPDIKRSHHKKADAGKIERYFGDFEILLQKIWRLRIDGIRVNKRNIEDLPVGYSVICDNARGNYKEVFKYALKGLFKKKKTKIDEEVDFDTALENMGVAYEEFKVLYYALHKRRIIQGYGQLYNLKFEEDIDQSSKGDIEYLETIEELKKLENPKKVFEFFNVICKNAEKNKDIVYMSRNSIADIINLENADDGWELKK